MIHNGIEYGLMQDYAKGLDIRSHVDFPEVAEEYGFDLSIGDIAKVWRRGSVVSSWLLDLTAMTLVEYLHLSSYTGHVQDSGEGRWTIMTAVEEAVPADVLSAALYTVPFAPGVYICRESVSAMHHKFGGHIERLTGVVLLSNGLHERFLAPHPMP